MKKILKYFNAFEWLLLLGGIAAIVVSFFIAQNTRYLYLAGSILGAIMLIFVSKGNVIGQVLTVAFSLFYGFVSYGLRYYGEMLTYLCMTTPIAIVAVISWLRHPHKGNLAEVEVNRISIKELLLLLAVGVTISVGFYFVLEAFNTAKLIPSTVSVLTSFLAVYLTARRSPFYALAYAANDIVLIVLWSLALAESNEYLPMVICFVVFLINDVYGFFNWLRMQNRQKRENESEIIGNK